MHNKNKVKNIFVRTTILFGMVLLSGGLLSGCQKKGNVDVVAGSSHTNYPKEAARLLNYLLNGKEMVRLQGTEKGVPVSRKAVRILQQENAIQSYEAAGNNKMIKERKSMSVLQPAMEDDDLLDVFKKNADEFIYGVKDIDTVAKKLYREMSAYNTKEDDSK